MSRALLLVVVVLLCGVVVQSATITAVKEAEYEILHLDYPNFIHALHHNPATNTIYAFGDATFRQVNHGYKLFEAVDNITISEYNLPWIDLRIFNTPGTSDMWMIGPTYYREGAGQTATNIGYFIPMSYAGPPSRNWASLQSEYRGYTFFAVSVDSRLYPNVVAYFVGWAAGPLLSIPADSVGFVVVRAKINFAQTPAARQWQWDISDTSGDIAVLYEDKYRPYHSTFRPYIIHDFTGNKLFVIDPETTSIYSILAPADLTSPISVNGGTLDLSHYGRLAGLNWHYFNEILYLGFSTDGSNNGSLLAVNLNSLSIVQRFSFDGYHNNPRAIAGVNETLYIGFEGGPSVIKFDVVKWQIVGSTRLPENLHQVYAAWDGGYDWIYFATYEQHSKVFRIHKLDFCPQGCPWDGWCEMAICQCPTGYTLTADNKCSPPAKPADTITTDKSTAIAMGVLFAVTFIAAVLGWVLFIRTRSGANYQRVM